MSLAEFKGRVTVGQRVTVVDILDPHMTGDRVVEEVSSSRISTRDQQNRFHCADWIVVDRLRVEGDTLHFLDEDSGRVFFSYTFHFDKEPQMTEPAAGADTGPMLARYRVTWTRTGTDSPRTTECIVDFKGMTRPGDPEQRDEMLRKMLGLRHLPIGHTGPENVQLLDVQPLCNCGPYPSPENCAYREHRGERFFLATAREPGFEWVTDRHDDKALGMVNIALSVDFLTLVRNRYGHQ